MNFLKTLVLFAIALTILCVGNVEAGFFSKIKKEAKRFGKRVEKIGQNTRDATIQGLQVAQQAANVGASIKTLALPIPASS